MRQAPATLLVVVALVCACALSSSALSGQASVEQRIARIEAHLVPGIVVKGGPPQALTMDDRMRALHTPAVSMAVLNDGAIEWARGYGVLKAGAPERATPHTRFQAASISKPVAAMAALRLVQDGRLSLDEDVNAKLISWKLPGNEFTTDRAGHAAPAAQPHGRPHRSRVPRLREQRRRCRRSCRFSTASSRRTRRPVRVDILPGSSGATRAAATR